MKDSLFSQANSSQLNSLEVQYRTKLQEADNVLLKSELIVNQSKIREKNLYLYGSLGLAGLILLASGFLFNSYKKQRRISTALKKSVKETNLAHSLLRDEKAKTDALNDKFTDSINSAVLIQNHSLPSKETIDSFLEDSFVFYRPKDILSGDFYLVKSKETSNADLIYFGVFDSTGHGIPGALLTARSLTLINEAIFSRKIYSPDEIFNEVRNGLKSFGSSSYSSSINSGGFDGVLCSYDKSTNFLSFAAANNSLYLVRDGIMKTYQPDKMPVGDYLKTSPFSLKSIQIQKGDVVYISSDGFQDQFGGPNDKKYKVKNFKSFLSSLDTSSMSRAGNLLETEFDSWKSSYEQVDDVLVMGIKF